MPGDDPAEITTPEAIARISRGVLPLGKFEPDRAAIYTFRARVAEKWRFGQRLPGRRRRPPGAAALRAGSVLRPARRREPGLEAPPRLAGPGRRGTARHLRERAASARPLLGGEGREHGRPDADHRPRDGRRPRRLPARESGRRRTAVGTAPRARPARRRPATSAPGDCRCSPSCPTDDVSTTWSAPASCWRPLRNCSTAVPPEVRAAVDADPETVVLTGARRGRRPARDGRGRPRSCPPRPLRPRPGRHHGGARTHCSASCPTPAPRRRRRRARAASPDHVRSTAARFARRRPRARPSDSPISATSTSRSPTTRSRSRSTNHHGASPRSAPKPTSTYFAAVGLTRAVRRPRPPRAGEAPGSRRVRCRRPGVRRPAGRPASPARTSPWCPSPTPCRRPGGGYGFRFFDLEGRTVEVSTEVEDRAHRRVEEKEDIPVRLSHVVLNSPDPEKMRAWYEQHLDFRLSDTLVHPHMGGLMWFMRINSRHHSMAIARCPHTSLHHASFELRGIDEYMRGSGRLMRAGGPEDLGPRAPPRRRQHVHVLPRPQREHDGVHDRARGARRGHLAPQPARHEPARGVRPVGHRRTR